MQTTCRHAHAAEYQYVLSVVSAGMEMLLGTIQVLRNSMGGGVSFLGKERYEGVRFNVISVTRGVGGCQTPWKKALRNT